MYLLISISKRCFDILLGTFALLVLSGVLALVAMAVKLTSSGKVLYWSQRVGKDNTVFLMPKFRTMRTETPVVATHLLSNPDTYLTPVGKFLRTTSLDELPELFNVLKGEMSLVGPRPLLMEYLDRYTPEQARRHDVLPGITGWAQVNGWRGETDTLEKIEQRVAHDMHYINNWSVLLDLYIIAITPFSLIGGKNAY